MSEETPQEVEETFTEVLDELNASVMKPERTVQHVTEVFTEEVLKAQDGKTVPLTLENGGPVIGEAVFHYDVKIGALIADFKVKDPLVAGFLRESMPNILGRDE